ncbi:glycosyltransferase family 4 protein [Aquimarina algicola]|uniref:Glycosyltransferase family 4 protein n=1 Tax=Aquimarina algicola TaxID=2589995 RepID=A0A504JHP8_9FLAO|nr:glycosyltransferase family 4 protein [Aquimarina algicola]TPN85981.1 glycosyltransferase family 4 protein [Aquimarina algicola]
MSLLFITQHYHPSKGGMAESCDRIVRNFRKHKADVHVIHFTNKRKKFRTEAAVQGSYTAVPVYNSEEFTLNLAFQFIEGLSILEDVKYIVVFGGHLPIVLGPILSKCLEKPLVTFIRGNDFDEAIFSKRREALLYTLKESKYIFTVTSEKKDKITKLIQHPDVYFTHNGIDCNLWQPAKSQLKRIDTLKSSSEERKRIVIVGQLKAKKGILEFSTTFSVFSHKEEYEIWMVGDIEASTKEYIDQLDITVRFFSFVNKNELITFYHAADIVLIPSFYDGMPNVLLEAGASKNLIIGSNVGGIKDVIEHEKDGFLFNPLKPSSLLEILTKVHRLDQEAKNEISNRLFDKISNEYTEEKEITNYLNKLQV